MSRVQITGYTFSPSTATISWSSPSLATSDLWRITSIRDTTTALEALNPTTGADLGDVGSGDVLYLGSQMGTVVTFTGTSITLPSYSIPSAAQSTDTLVIYYENGTQDPLEGWGLGEPIQ